MSEETEKSAVIEFKPNPIRAGETNPAGWFRIDSTHPGHKGTKGQVFAQIESCGKLPAHWKAALLAEISAMNCAALEIHAHCTSVNGRLDLSCTLKPLF